MRPSRVLLADDNPSLAAAIWEYVAEAFQLVGTVRHGDALIEAAKTLKPDVIVADIWIDRDEADPEAPAVGESDPADQLWGCRGGKPRT